MYPIDFFFRAAERFPERIALDGPQGQVSYAQLAQQTRTLAAALQHLDPAPQTRVAICAANSAQHILALLAVLASGKVWVPLNYRSTEREVGRILQATEPSIVIADALGETLVAQAGAHRVALDGAASGLALEDLLARHAGQPPQRAALDGEAIQAIKFTGGTTGLPKGVMQPYRAWTAGIMNQIVTWGLTEADRYVMAAPVTHGTGTYLLPVLAQGGCHLLLDGAGPQAVTAAFRERGGTLSFMPPTLIYMIMAQDGVSRADFPQLRNLIYGGAPMPVEKIEQVRAFFGPVLGTTYGQTEAPQIVTALPPAELEVPANRGSVGRLTWLSELAILGPDGTALPRGEIGEVAVRGDLVMRGYWRLPEKTAETLVDGWLRTGDTGLMDARGYLFLKDRLRDVIITGGFNVYPKEVETEIDALPGVIESAVVGCPHPDFGEGVTAVVVLKQGATADEKSVIAALEGKLAKFKLPKRVLFVDDLPRNTMGKVQKNVLREQNAKLYAG